MKMSFDLSHRYFKNWAVFFFLIDYNWDITLQVSALFLNIWTAL